jgi:hypothetical protein
MKHNPGRNDLGVIGMATPILFDTADWTKLD